MVYKLLNGLAPDYLAERFANRSSITNCTLRDTSGKLAIPQARTDYSKNSFSYSGAVLWNPLPIVNYDKLALYKNLSLIFATCFDNLNIARHSWKTGICIRIILLFVI